jgi:hypothetical protein
MMDMERAAADAVTDPLPSENRHAEGGRRSGWIVIGFVVLGLLGALAGVAGYVRQSELLNDESELPAEGDDGEPVVVYAAVPPLESAFEVEPLVEAPLEPAWAPEPVAVHDVADDVAAEEAVETPVVDERAEEVMAVDVPAPDARALDEAAPQEVHSESGESRIDFEPAALFADPLAMRDRRGSLRR